MTPSKCATFSRYVSALIASVAIIVLFLAPILASTEELTKNPQAIKIAAPKILSMGLISLALHDNLFEKYGQPVEIVWTMTGRDASQLLFEKKVDLAAAYDTVVIANHFRQLPQTIYSRLHSAKYNTAIVGKKSSGITSAADLRNKTIAVTKLTSAQYFLKLVLEKNLIRNTDVNIVFAEPDELIKLYRTSEIDAVVSWEPLLSQLNSDPDSMSIQHEMYVESSLLFGRSDPQTSHEVVTKILRALYEASQTHLRHPDESIPKILQTIGIENSPGIRSSLTHQTLELRVTNLLMGQLNYQKDWLLSEYQQYDIARNKLSDSFELDPLKKISPYLVTVPAGIL